MATLLGGTDLTVAQPVVEQDGGGYKILVKAMGRLAYHVVFREVIAGPPVAEDSLFLLGSTIGRRTRAELWRVSSGNTFLSAAAEAITTAPFPNRDGKV